MTKTSKWLWITILLAFALVTTTTRARAHGDPELIVAPDTIAAGGSIQVKGMAVGEKALIVVTLESETATVALGTAEGDNEGNFEKEFVVPPKTPAGNYQVRAAGVDGRVARAPLKVQETGAAPSVSIAATQLMLDERKGQLAARLQDPSGKPIAAQVITFTQRATFGTLVLGAGRTDRNGLAEIDLPETAARETEVGAEFGGSPSWAASRTRTMLNAGAPATYSEIPAGLITPNPPDALRIGIGVLVLGVWSVYAYAAYNLFRLWQDRAKPDARGASEK